MKEVVSEKDSRSIEEYRRRMSLHHDEKQEDNIVEEIEELAQVKPSILAGDEEDTILRTNPPSLAHTNVLIEDILESSVDVAASTIIEATTLREEEINEGNNLTISLLITLLLTDVLIAIDNEASDDVINLINDVDDELPAESKMTKKRSKKSLSDNAHFVLSCHIIPRSDRINSSRYFHTL